MTSDSYTDLRNDLYKDIDEKLEKNNVIVNDNGPAASPWFANYGTAREVFGTSILRRIYRSLAEGITTDSENPELPLKITEETFVSRIQARDLHDVFAVLMYALCQVGAARAMTEKFVTISDDEWQENYYKEPMPGLPASCLPFDQHSLNDIIGEERVSAVQEFHQKQRLFCVVTLEEGKDVVALEPDLYRLPFLKVSQIGTGSYGIVSRIVIAKNYVKFKQGRGHSRNDKPYELARKDYTKSKDFQEEYKVMKSILNSRRSCNTILRSFGSLQVGTNMFSLFMPLALYDLDEWMRKRPPTDLEEKAEVINCMAGIAEGLYFLHTSVSGEHGESLICYHMDLKPNNILVFEREDAPGKFIWKISDFGMSRVKSTKRPTKDLEELFKPTEASLASPTRNRRFQGTYLAPESLLPDGQQMDERSDIWSLGCVIMVVFTYLFMGPSGIKLFSEERGHKSKEWANNDIDTFYLPPKNRLFEEAQPHPIVAKWHEKLMFGHGDPVEAHIVTTMLVYLTNSIVVVDREVRKKADELQRKLEGTYRKYHRLISGQNETIDSTPKAEPSIWKKLGWTKTTKDSPVVHDWLLTKVQNSSYQGSQVFHDGKAVLSWTHQHMCIFSMRPPNQGRKSMIPTTTLDCFTSAAWFGACLSDRYLLALTKGSQSHMYLFDMHGRDLIGPHLQYCFELNVFEFQASHVKSCVVSPDGSHLACVVQMDATQTEAAHVRVFVLQSERILEDEHNSSITGDESRQNTPISRSISCWRDTGLPLDSSQQEAVFHSEDNLFIVMKSAAPNSKKGQVEIWNWDLSHNVLDQITVDAAPNDSESGHSFTSCAYHPKTKIYTILIGNNRLVRMVIGGDPLPQDKDSEDPPRLKGYRLKQLLPCNQSLRLYGIGAKAVSSTIHIFELLYSDDRKTWEVLDIVKIPGLRITDKFTGRLHKVDEPDSIARQITISVWAIHQPVLYTVELPP